MDPSWFGGQVVLMIVAHPDDVVGANGGFVSAVSAAGGAVHVLVLTNGNAGCNASVTKQECAAIRQREEVACDGVLGVGAENVTVLQQFDDNHLWDSTYPLFDVVEQIVLAVRRVRPYAVFTFFPQPMWSLLPRLGYDDMGFHPDHQQTGALVASAVAGYSTSDPAIYNETSFGVPWSPSELWFWNFGSPTWCFPLSDEQLKVKQRAFLQHHSQYTNATELEAWVALFSTLVGSKCQQTAGGQNVVVWAEGFQRYL